MADEEAGSTLIDEWKSCSDFLANKFEKQLRSRELSDRISRVTHEQGSGSLIADALAEALEKEPVFLDVADFRKAKHHFPLLAWTSDLVPFLISGRTFKGEFQVLRLIDGELHEHKLKANELTKSVTGAVYFEDQVLLDVWERGSAFSNTKRWFWGSIVPLVKSMKFLLLAALIGNLLSVGVSLFAMQVWDRVIPAQSLNSLTVLILGVGVAVLFEFILKLQRAALIDEVGKSVDASISSGVFSHMLDLKSDARPPSLGTLAAQVRELNQIREAIASSMLSAAIDLPFIALFLFIIYLIGGPLVWPIIAVIPIVIVLGLIAQFPLAKLANEGLEESALRNGLIVETALKSDEIKIQQAEQTMLLRWEKAVEVANNIALKQRRWRTFLSSSTQSLQQIGYISVVAFGAMNVIAGTMTMGQVIGCSILANRAISPLNQLSVVMGAFQGSRVAKRSIDELMSRETDTPNANHLRRGLVAPSIEARDVAYAYPGHENAALRVGEISIKHGEHVGIIGRIGSGKSTLLRLLSGLSAPSDGVVLMDDTDVQSIHPSDLRKAVGYLAQGSPLLRGTVRDNLLIARPSATDEEMLAACEKSGALALIKENPKGLDLYVNEAGKGLSGGQTQSLLLARTILRDSPIILLDEPTASMDDESERNLVEMFSKWGKGKTLIIATHRMVPLNICDRLIVVHRGKVVLDGKKDVVLKQLKEGFKSDEA